MELEHSNCRFFAASSSRKNSGLALIALREQSRVVALVVEKEIVMLFSFLTRPGFSEHFRGQWLLADRSIDLFKREFLSQSLFSIIKCHDNKDKNNGPTLLEHRRYLHGMRKKVRRKRNKILPITGFRLKILSRQRNRSRLKSTRIIY